VQPPQSQSQTPKVFYSGAENLRSKCVVGLDRDGVLNKDLGTYCFRPEDLEPIEGSMEAVADLRRKGYKIVIITDQGGIEKGLFTQEDVDNTNMKLMELLGRVGCLSIDALYYSASSDKRDPFAKPNTGMFKRCEKENKAIKFKEGYYVGDKMKDLKAAVRMGAKPVLVRTGYGKETELELDRYSNKEIKRRVVIFDNLAQFVESLE